MAVLLANTAIGLTRMPEPGVDAHGCPVPGYPDDAVLVPAAAARASEDPQAGWTLAVDVSLWPVREGDLLTEPAGQQRTWRADTADLLTNTAAPDVDYVRVTARLSTAAGTQPGGPEFVGQPL